MTNKQSKWYSLEVTARPEAEEAIEFALNELAALGTEINNLGKQRAENIKVVGYFHEMLDPDLVSDHIAEALRIYALPDDAVLDVGWQEVENKDWLAEWKKHWKATSIGKFIIAPPWEEVDADSGIVITIEPNMAFGTGTHETTQLCLAAIGEFYDPQQSFLDVGTGTGILAIAAAKLGGTHIMACDTDEDSVRLAKENADANGVSGQIEFVHGPIDESSPGFDLVCANLTIDVIFPILPRLISKSMSCLLLSGILVEQEGMIVEGLKNAQASNFTITRAGEWICVNVALDPAS